MYLIQCLRFSSGFGSWKDWRLNRALVSYPNPRHYILRCSLIFKALIWNLALLPPKKWYSYFFRWRRSFKLLLVYPSTELIETNDRWRYGIGCRKPDANNRRKKLEMCVFENLVREQIIKTQCTLNIVVTRGLW